jgi:hypothetical protein
MIEKQAGGEILGGLASLASRPFVGAERAKSIGSSVVNKVTQNFNNPIDRGLRRIGVHKAISKGIEYGMTPVSSKRINFKVPFTDKHIESAPYLPLKEQRQAYGNWKADDAVKTLSENPEILPLQLPPPFTPPGSTSTYMGLKAGLKKLVGHPMPGAAAAAQEASSLRGATLSKHVLNLPNERQISNRSAQEVASEIASKDRLKNRFGAGIKVPAELQDPGKVKLATYLDSFMDELIKINKNA